MNEKLLVLHISDLHVRNDEKERFDRSVVLDPLLKRVKEDLASGLKPEVIVVTGDVAYSGIKAEYDLAKLFLNDLLNVFKYSANRLFIVPGNHDVNRKKYRPTEIPKYEDMNQLNLELENSDYREDLLRGMNDYFKFVEEFYPHLQPVQKNLIPFVNLHKTPGGKKIALVGLNSAWMCRKSPDEKKIAVGEYQIKNAKTALKELEPFDLAMYLLHHPLPYLWPVDRKICRSYINGEKSILLGGHLHEPGGVIMDDLAGRLVQLQTGGAYLGSESVWPSRYQYITIDWADNMLRLDFRAYDKEERKWHVDAKTGEDGHKEFELFRAVRTTVNQEKPRYMDSTSYLQWLQAEYGNIDIRGLVVGSGKAHSFGIEELYIPLTTQRESAERKQKEEGHPADMDHRPVELHEALKHPRLAITGDPGAGKTTFLKRITCLLSCIHLDIDAANARRKMNLNKDYFPIFIRLSKLTEHIHNCRQQKDGSAPTLADSPEWMIHFCVQMSAENNWGLSTGFFREKMKAGEALVLLDGLDEAPDLQVRQGISELVAQTVAAYPLSRYVITSRPLAYTGRVVLERFRQVKIEPLGQEAIEVFLEHWTDSLHGEGTPQASTYHEELSAALTSRYEIRRMAANPMMLTALAVVHWNDKRIPEQRAELYESIITWLLRSREQRPGRLPEKQCAERLQALALSMQDDPAGRQIQVGRRNGAERIATLFPEPAPEKSIAAAERFLAEEEVDSGIIVGQGMNEIVFWHLTFQEYLAAKAIGGKCEEGQKKIVVTPAVLHNPDWREVLTLFGGVLYGQGKDKVDGFMRAVLDLAGQGKPLVDEARCVGLLGSIVQCLAPFKYRIMDPRYRLMRDRVMDIFTVEASKKIPLDVRLEAAEALGQAGDPRMVDHRNEAYWVPIPAGSFWMGVQKDKKKAPNYDPDAYPDEFPVHEVTLSAYRIGRYPVTVREYRRFMEDGGYIHDCYWSAGGIKAYQQPENWDEQFTHRTWPVTGVSWYEAMAFAAWAGAALPTEAQWERAARGPAREYRRYPWGDEALDAFRANYAGTKIGHPTPVGMFPAGVTSEGIDDLTGNIWEWCADWYGDYPQGKVMDPTGPPEGSDRVFRGGSWFGDAGICRSSFRSRSIPGDRINLLGFRLTSGQSQVEPGRPAGCETPIPSSATPRSAGCAGGRARRFPRNVK